MMSLRVFRNCFASALLLAALSPLCAQVQTNGPVGIFQGSTDIGEVKPGDTVFNKDAGTYTLKGGGADLWDNADQFHFAWTMLSGDATLSATVAFANDSDQKNEKAVVMVRQSLDADSPYADVAIHRDGHITLQYRLQKGMATADVTFPANGSKTITLQRKGDHVIAYANGYMKGPQSIDIPMQDPVYIGIGVCAHDAKGLDTVTFSDVKYARQGRTVHIGR